MKKIAPLRCDFFNGLIKLFCVFRRAFAVKVISEKTGFIFHILTFDCSLAELTAFKNALETDKAAECRLKIDFVAVLCCHPYITCAVGKLVDEAL